MRAVQDTGMSLGYLALKSCMFTDYVLSDSVASRRNFAVISKLGDHPVLLMATMLSAWSVTTKAGRPDVLAIASCQRTFQPAFTVISTLHMLQSTRPTTN